MSGRGHSLLPVLAILVSATFASADPKGEEVRLDPALKLLYRAQIRAPKVQGRASAERERSLEIVGLLQTAKTDAPPPSSLLLLLQFEGEERQLEDVGFNVQSRVGTIYSGVLDPDRLPELAGLPGIGFVEISRTLRHFQQTASRLPDTVIEPNLVQASLPLAIPAVPPGAGAGVLVAFIDTGVDIWHQDFRNPDGTTRIEFLLDLSDPGDVDSDGLLDGPDDLGGTLYTREEINKALRGSGAIRERDTTGHGTHGLSIAAGDAPRFPGMAPGATLLVVKATRRDGTLDFESADLLSALSFIDRKAAELGMPYVINLSLGTSYGPHDGRTAEELAIDALVGPGIPGKAVVLAAGNSADRGGSRYRHFQGTAFTGLETQHTLTIPDYSAPRPGVGKNTVLLDLWYEGEDRLVIRVTAPDGTTSVEAAYGDFADIATPYGQIFIANLGGRNPRNGDTEAVILLYDKSGQAPSSGAWTISVRGEAVSGSGVYHGWLVDGASRVGDVEPFLSAGADNDLLIARPAAAAHGITVGSFARHDPASRFRTTWTDVQNIVRNDVTARLEEISAFSSPGMTRDGRLKPEITAPGEQVMGAVSRDAYPGVSPYSLYAQHPFAELEALILAKESDAAFGMMQGTSFSAPVVTGLVARLLAVAPSLDAIQIRNLLLNSALTDGHTGQVPNASWGWGKAALSLAVRPQDPLPNPLRLTPDLLPSGVVGHQYNQLFTASGGRPPYALSLAAGVVPPGLELAAGTYLMGKPTSPGLYEFSLELRDASVPAQIRRHNLHLTIAEKGQLAVVTEFVPLAKRKTPYEVKLTAQGGSPTYSWTLIFGSLPPGLVLQADGIIRGIPAGVGSFNITVGVSDVFGAAALKSLSLNVVDPFGNDWVEAGALRDFVGLLAIDPLDPDHLYAGVGDGSSRAYDIFESTDGASSWRNISINNGTPFGIGDIRVDPRTSELWGISGGYQRFLLRYDRTREEWIQWPDCSWWPSDYSDILGLDFNDAGGIFLLSHRVNCANHPERNGFRGFLVSGDSGRTWRNQGFFGLDLPDSEALQHEGFLSVHRRDPRFIYASRATLDRTSFARQEEFFRSLDGGRTWAPLGVNHARVSEPYVSQQDPFDIIRRSSEAIERSTDGGLTWQDISVPESRGGCSFARSDSNPSILVAGKLDLAATGHGLVKSDDNGATWQSLFVPPQHFCFLSIAIDPSDPLRIYAGASSNRIFHSVDGGSTWRVRGRNLFSRRMGGIAINNSDPLDLLALSGAPYLSRTGGARWILSSVDLGRFSSLGSNYEIPLIAPNDPSLRFFFHGGLFQFRSEDGGLTWREIVPTYFDRSGILIDQIYYIQAIASDPFDANILLARLSVGLNEFTSIWRSEDRGRTWHQKAEVSPSPFIGELMKESSIAFVPETEGLVFAVGPSGLYESRSKGDSWRRIANFPSPPLGQFTYRLALKLAPNDSRYLYIIRDHSVGRYDRSSETWNWRDFPEGGDVFMSLAVDASNPQVAYLGRSHTVSIAADYTMVYKNGSGGIDKTSDGGRTWTRLPGFSTSLSVISLVTHPTQSGVVYAASREDGVYRSSDGGLTWERLDDFGVIADIVNITVIDPANPSLLFAGTQGFGVQVSTDGGQIFVPRNAGLTNLNVTSLAFDPGSPSILYAGTEDGLFKTTDSGTTWLPTAFVDGLVTDISVVGPTRPRMIRITTLEGEVAVSEDEGRSFNILRPGLGTSLFTSIETEGGDAATRLWLTLRGGEGVAVSEDGGRIWRSAAGSGLTNRNVHDLLVEPGNGRVWIATDDGVFSTNDIGRTWTGISAGLPLGIPVTSLSLDPNTGEIFVSLSDERSGGVFRGGNVRGAWTAFSGGLPELRINKLTNDGGHPLEGTLRGTTFYAATAGSGFFSNEVLASGTAGAGPRITTTVLSAGSLGESYSGTLTATGGVGPYFWTLASGSLPPGLGLYADSGLVVGLPVRGGLYRFTVQVADAASRTAQKELSIQVRDSSIFLKIEKAGGGSGVVRSSPPGIACGADCGEEFAAGAVVTLSAEPARGSQFLGWTGAGCSGTGPCRLAATGLQTVTATFAKAGATLTVRRAGGGDGRVISSPPGIDCGKDCDETYAPGTRVRLKASPASGSVFQGWTGKGCGGTGDCLVTLRGAREVTANFTRHSRAADHAAPH